LGLITNNSSPSLLYIPAPHDARYWEEKHYGNEAKSNKKVYKKDGSTAYMFKKYLGIDPVTGKQRETTRRGFSSSKEGKEETADIFGEFMRNGKSLGQSLGQTKNPRSLSGG
jgi:hypothetical protein